MENTFGYNPITGCQECQCATEGTINADMSCDLESGKCKYVFYKLCISDAIYKKTKKEISLVSEKLLL